jgi:PEP-CTERM motif
VIAILAITSNTEYTIALNAAVTASNAVPFDFQVTPGGASASVETIITVDPAYADEFQIQFSPGVATPEPSTWAMMLLGFAGLGFAFRRQSRRRASLA